MTSGASFHLCLFILLLKCVKCSPVPASFFPYLSTSLHWCPKPGRKEAGTGEHLTHFNNKINKHKWKAAAPHGRLPHTKHKLKIQAWSSLVFHCCHSSFNPSEAPPWDSRPVSGAGVVHYQLLHRPRSVPGSRPRPTRHNIVHKL